MQYVKQRWKNMQRNLTEGNVFRNMISFSVPFLLSNFLQALYGLADLYIVGQFNGAEITSAVSVGSQVMHMLTVVTVGLAMGSTVRLSQSIGAGDQEEAARSIGNTVSLFAAVSVIAMALLLFLTDPIVRIMSTPPEAVAQTRIYLLICFAGIPFIVAYNIISAIFRGIGDSKSPMYFVAVACVLNIILDFVFIGGFHMKAAGAACGTVTAQAASVVFALVSIRRRSIGVAVQKKDFILAGKTVGGILNIGIPVAAQEGFIQISFILITVIANKRGVEVAAAVGIVEKIISFMFLIPSSMLSTVSAMAAQNIGAGQQKRARQTLYYGIAFSASCGAVFFIICQFVSMPLVGLFTKDAVVVVYGSQYLRAYTVDCMLAGIHFCFSGYFCACGKSYLSFVHNILAIILLRIPGAYFASVIFTDTLFPMGLAAPAGSLLSDIICVGVFIWLYRKTIQTEVDRQRVKC